MADNTKIEWADATISPLYGCSKVSPACEHCYAERLAARMSRNPGVSKLYVGTVDESGHWTGKLNLHPTRMEQALRWKKPRRIFVASQSDLFHEDVPDNFIDTVFAYMLASHLLENCARHTFLLLTKRAARMRDYLSASPSALLERWANAGEGLIFLDDENDYFSEVVYSHASWDGRIQRHKSWAFADRLFPLPNVHLGVTVENQEQADARIPHLLGAPAALRFVSVEPMLEPMDLSMWLQEFLHEDEVEEENPDQSLPPMLGCPDMHDPWMRGLDHVICGGESGPHARPMHPDWVRSLRDQCAAAGVPFMFKQWGEWCPRSNHPIQGKLSASDIDPKCSRWDCTRLTESGGCGWTCEDMDDGNDVYMQRVGRTKAGRLLDGVEHNALPEAPHA